MICSEVRDLLDAYGDGELDLVRQLDIESHLRDCRACAAIQEARGTLRSALAGSSLYAHAPASLRQRVQSAVRAAGDRGRVERGARGTLFWRRALLAASFVLVFVVGWRLAPLLSRSAAPELLAQQVLTSHLRSLLPGHLTDQPSSDQHTVKPWFAGKLDFSPPVPDLAAQGFVLVGGRLDYVADRPVAALVYSRRQHIINLFVWPAASGPDAAEQVVSRSGYNLRHWTQAGMSFWAASDLNASELEQFAGFFRRD